MLSAQTYQTYLTDKQNVIQKQSSTDHLANPDDIQINFAENQPGAYNTAPNSKMGQTTQPQSAPGPSASQGSNPFENKKTDRSEMSDDEGDIEPSD